MAASTQRELAAWMDELSRKVGSGIKHRIVGRGRGQRIIAAKMRPKLRREPKAAFPSVQNWPDTLTPEAERPPLSLQQKFVVTLAGHEGRGRRRKPVLFVVLSIKENERGQMSGVRYSTKSSAAFLFSDRTRADKLAVLCRRQGMYPAVHPVEVLGGQWDAAHISNVWENKIWNSEVR